MTENANSSKKSADDCLPAVLRRRYKSLKEEGYNEDFCRALTRAAEALERCGHETPSPQTAEQRLCAAGVFKGMEGLRGLLNATEFWERQPYGTRLYYGDGGLQYLHRHVLEAAVDILDGKRGQEKSARACRRCDSTDAEKCSGGDYMTICRCKCHI